MTGGLFRIIFAGVVLDGFEVEAVKLTAVKRLKLTPEQLVRLFSGKPAVLKKGLDGESADRYVTELRRIGMKVKVESMVHHAESQTPEAPQPKAFSTPLPILPSPETEEATSDMEKTQLANEDALARYLSADPGAPTLVVPTSQAQELASVLAAKILESDDPATAPTIVVAHDKISETSQKLAQAISAHDDPGMALTIAIPYPNQGSGLSVVANGATNLSKVPVARPDEPERTLIANPDALEAYLAGSPDPIAQMKATNIGQMPVVQEEAPALATGPSPEHAEPVTPPMPLPLLEPQPAASRQAAAQPEAVFDTSSHQAKTPLDQLSEAPAEDPAELDSQRRFRRPLPKSLPQPPAPPVNETASRSVSPNDEGAPKLLLALIGVTCVALIALLVWIVA